MKLKSARFLLVLLCLQLSSFLGYAQEENAIVEGEVRMYTQVMDSLLMPLNKSRIPYSILYDRVFPFVNLKEELSADDTINTETFIQAYSELERANYNYFPNDTVFDHNDVRDYLNSENRQNRIPIMAINTLFASIDSLAFRDGRLDTTEGLIHDGLNP